MKKSLKKIISIVVSLAIILSTVAVAHMSYAATPVSYERLTFDVWADPNGVMDQTKVQAFTDDKLATLGGIKPFKNSTLSNALYYLFLPSNTDCTSLVFWFDGTLTIDGTNITSGVPTDVLASINEGGVTKRCTFVDNGSSHTVVCMKSGDVGSVFVDTNSGSMKTVYESSDHSANEPGAIMVVQPDGTVDYIGSMEKIQGRGNATWSTSSDKNPFNIKLPTAASLLGMKKAKKWCLLANASDSSLLKNQITYDFSKYIGIKYQPTCKPVDLYINQQYYGSYQLSERVEIKTNRIEVNDAYDNLEIANSEVDETTGILVPSDLENTPVNSVSSSGAYVIGNKKYSSTLKEPVDVTGGYLYELEISDRWIAENAGFCAYNKQCWVMKNCDYASQGMVDYSYDLLFALGSSVYNGGVVPSVPTTNNYSKGNSVNPAPAEQYQGKRWNEILDSDSAVKYYIVEELFKNLDASTSSCYFYKDSNVIDPMLYAGPVWDMDKCWGYSGTRWGCNIGSTDGWYAKNVRIYKYNSGSDLLMTDSNDSQRPLAFLGQLCTQQDFWNEVERIWQSKVSPAIDILLGNSVDETGTLRSINDYASTIDKSATMNATRFSYTGSGNYSVSSNVSTLSNWISGRRNWINQQITHYDISDTVISDIAPQSFSGEKIEPALEISHTKNGIPTALEKDVDYTVEFTDNINAGTATATISGAGIYSGSTTKTFVIAPMDLTDGSSVKINSTAAAGSTLSVSVRKNGVDINSGVMYQWYKDGEAVDGATSAVFETTEDDMDSQISVSVTGDGINVLGTVTSNSCTITESGTSGAITKTVASWNYDFTADSTALADIDAEDDIYTYAATSGENAQGAYMNATVNTRDSAPIVWSGSDVYVNGAISNQAPIIGTSKTDMIAWGEYPYFDINISTLGFENLDISAKIGGSKRAPRTWKVQYSTDSVNFIDIPNSEFTIPENKTLVPVFNNVALPQDCSNVEHLTIRLIACEDMAINGINTIIGQLSGDAAINDVVVTGTSTSVVTYLDAPIFGYESGTQLYDDQLLSIADPNGGVDIYYTINGGEPQLYDAPISLFDAATAKYNDTVTVEAWTSFGRIVSDTVTAQYTFNGVDIVNFSYDNYSTSVSNGAVASVGGVYQNSGRMTAYADASTQFVPLWRTGNSSFCVAPDDGARWSANSGFTYKVSTAGFENVSFTADASTTLQGPNSVVLQYSLDGVNFVDVTDNIVLGTTGLAKAFDRVMLSAECTDRSEVYIRLATKENRTSAGEVLFGGASKGNLYVNNVIIAGEDNDGHKMPFTNKSSNCFGSNGTVDYISPDGEPIKYAVFGKNSNLLESGVMENNSIKLADAAGFNPNKAGPYTVMVWTGEVEDRSQVNTRSFYFKGTTLTKFDYNLKSRLLENYLDATATTATSTSGIYEGKLSMMPNTTTKTALSYTDTYGVKVAWAQDNTFAASKVLDNPAGNGFWLIETSTENYSNITMTLKQLSSNKGPRDWGIACSTDGVHYTYVPSSNARAISNDASATPVETYGNFALPSYCDDQEKLYIKVFINGGESVDGAELATLLKGNTGINGIELCGVEMPQACTLTINTVAKDAPSDKTGTFPVDAIVKVDGREYNTVNGSVSVPLEENETAAIEASLNGTTFVEKRSIAINTDTTMDIAIVPLDYVADGYINAKDYAYASKALTGEAKSHMSTIFANYYNYTK